MRFRTAIGVSALAIIFIALAAFQIQKAGAASFFLPDPTEMSAGDRVHLVIAQTGTSGQINLEAQESWVKIYFEAAASNRIGVQMADGKFDCNPAFTGLYDYIDTQGSSRNCTDPAAVNYDVFCSDISGNDPELSGWTYGINSNDPKINDSAGPGYHQIFTPITLASPCPIIDGYYIVYVRAQWVDPAPGHPEGRINGFKVGGSVGKPLASYWSGQNKFYAVQNRIDQMTPSEGEDNMSFAFAPLCTAPATTLASLIWSDADANSNGGAPVDGISGASPGAFLGDSEPYFDLIEANPGGGGGTVMLTVNSGGYTVNPPYSVNWITADTNIGGDGPGSKRQVQFTARNDKIYRWAWRNMNYNNGVQMILPFDSFGAAKASCGGPGGAGGFVQGRVFYDNDGLGSRNGVEPIIETTAAGCVGSPRLAISSVNITASGNTGSPGSCAPDGSVGPDPPNTYGYYKIPAAPESVTVSITIPPGWVPTTPTSYTVTVVAGEDVDVPWFGMRLAGPTVTPKCVNSVSLADITWGPAPIANSGFYADIDDSPGNFSGQFWNKDTGGSTSTSAPAGFGPYPGAGPALDFKTNPGTYTARIFYRGPNLHTAPTTFTTEACPELVCGTVSTIPGEPEDGDPFEMRVSFRNIGTGQLSTAATLKVYFPGQPAVNDAPYSPDPLPGNQTAISNPITYNVGGGSYTVTWTVTGDLRSNQLINPNPPPKGTCSGTVDVAKKPYIRTFGGDVIAGGDAACSKWAPTAGTTGSILAFSNSGGKGSGTQLLTQALSVIGGFSSAQHRTGPLSPKHDNGLSFANTGIDPYGNAFGIGSCPPDYYGDPTAVAGILPVTAPLALTSGGSYLSSGPLPLIITPLIGGGTVDAGKKIVTYVNGDAYITTNITYNTGSPWGSVANIPSYALVVRGNIYIAPGVTKLDGIYIAQPRT